MRILFLVPNARKCGPINVVLALIKNINCEEKIVLSLFGRKDDSDIVEAIEKNGAKFCSLGLNMKDIIFSSKRIEKIIKSFQPDVVNSHGIQSDILLSKIKWNGLKVSTIHCNFFEDYSDRFGLVLGHIIARFHCLANNKIDANICCSSSVYDEMKKSIKRCVFVRNGIVSNGYTRKEKEQKKTALTNKLSIPNNSTLFVYLGVLNKRKDVVGLIKLFMKSRKAGEYLIVIGDGEKYKKCKKYENEYIKILGKKNSAREYLIASDIYVSNSKSEGLSISVLEAIDAGNALLLSNIPSHKECVGLVNKKMPAVTYKYNTFEKCKNKVLKEKAPQRLPICISNAISSERMAEEYIEIFKKEKKV